MPNNTQQDIAFQPKTQGYSYSANGVSSKNSNPKTKDYRIYLLLGISLLIIILLAALYYLNNSGKINLNNIKPANKPDVSTNAKNLGAPFYNPDLKQTVASAIFVGINKNNLEVETSEGKKTFIIDSNTTFESLVANSNANATNGGTLSKEETYTPDTFASQVPEGSFIQVFYVAEGKNLKAVKIYYIPDYKFN